MPTGDRLDADRDLDIAMAVAAETNRVIAAADVKAGLLLAAQGVVIAGSAAAIGGGASSLGALWFVAVAVLLSGASVVLLVIALWPRTAGSSRWLAFPVLRLDGAVRDRPAPSELANEAWVQAGTLAGIARRKYGWFRAALVAGVAGVLTFASWLVLAAFS
ncbi:hypothetical protein [Pseudonocardia humida]|uniref:Pycsar effector protein domain-containing protein n=1 Tax=Pseudonocardia humida TaxID=2800819 RepID=A0ABT1A2X7_9PSEU|nr:hypothetical protein [Pseudonocardia humida]MCO1657347.1 hypothetical protein [Pseudonocardia humida]